MNGTHDTTKNGADAEVQQEQAIISKMPVFDISAKIDLTKIHVVFVGYRNVMLVGDSSVGKTCLLTRFRDGTFLSGSFICTVGIDFRIPFNVHDATDNIYNGLVIHVPYKLQNKVLDIDGVKVKMQIWDTAGQERFRSITRAYYREAEALLLVYDVANQTSFDNIRNWVTEIQEYSKKSVILMLLGNKADLTAEKVVETEQGQRLAEECGMPFMETSAKSGLNVEWSFTALARTLKEMKSPSKAKETSDGKKSLQRYLSRGAPSNESSCSC